MAKVFLSLLLTLTLSSAFSQGLSSKRYVKTDSFKYEFYVTDKKLKEHLIHDSLFYFWCKAQKVFSTQGGFSGKIVNGRFVKFYHTGQLAEQGNFKMGVRHGEWKTWHSNGNIKTVYYYRKGKKRGHYYHYDSSGKVLNLGKYRNNKLKTERKNTEKETQKIEKRRKEKKEGKETKKRRKEKVDDEAMPVDTEKVGFWSILKQKITSKNEKTQN